MTNTLAEYQVREIVRIIKKPYKGDDKLFFDRIRRKLNEGKFLDTGEHVKLKILHHRATEPKR